MKKLGLMALSLLLLAWCGTDTETIEVKVMEVNDNGETVEKVIEVTEEEAMKVAEEAGVELEEIKVETEEEESNDETEEVDGEVNEGWEDDSETEETEETVYLISRSCWKNT